MPLEEYVWIDRQDILTFEEIERVARIFVRLGAEKIRVTGGEPLVRKNLELLISQLARIEGLKDICLTTNGALLRAHATALKAAGLHRCNVSVDSLDPDKFKQITGRGNLADVLDGIEAAREAGISPIKLNAVIERGVNEDDIIPLVEFSRSQGFPIRFIEYMDVGNSNHWISKRMVPAVEILERINSGFPVRRVGRTDGAPAVAYEFVDGRGDIGIIASVTEPFCGDCSRARLTADGKLVTCLFADRGYDLKGLLRGGATDEEMITKISRVWTGREDRYSEQRLTAMNSPGGYHPNEHRKIEMITLGG